MPCRPHRSLLAMAALPPSLPPQPLPDPSARIPNPLHRAYPYPHRVTASRRNGKACFHNGVFPFASVAKDRSKQRMIREWKRRKNHQQILNRPNRLWIVIDQLPRPHRRQNKALLLRRIPRRRKLQRLVPALQRRPLHGLHHQQRPRMSAPDRLSLLYQAPEQQPRRLVCRLHHDLRGRHPYGSHQLPKSPQLSRTRDMQDIGAR